MNPADPNPYLLTTQFLLQLCILFGVLSAVARREGQPMVQSTVLKAVAISLGSVLIEAFFTHKAGWMILPAVIGVAVVVLRESSWTSMWSTSVAVSLFCVFYLTLTVGFGSQSDPAPARAAVADRTDPMRYQQIAEELKNFAPKPKATRPAAKQAPRPAAPLPEPARARPRPAAQAPAPARPARVPDPTPHPTPSSQAEWVAAQLKLAFAGSMARADGTRLALINDQLYEERQILPFRHEGRVYHWRVASISAHKVNLEPVGVRAVH